MHTHTYTHGMVCANVCMNVCTVSVCLPVSTVNGCFCVCSTLYMCTFVCVSRLTEKKEGLSSETETIKAKLKRKDRERQKKKGREKNKGNKIHEEGRDDAAVTVCAHMIMCVCVQGKICYLTAHYHADCQLVYSSASLSVPCIHTHTHIQTQKHKCSGKQACIVRRGFWLKICPILITLFLTYTITSTHIHLRLRPAEVHHGNEQR